MAHGTAEEKQAGKRFRATAARLTGRPGGAATADGPIPPFPAGRFLSEAECHVLLARAASFARGGGPTLLFVASSWSGNLRWARNGVISAGDIRTNFLRVNREVPGRLDGESFTNVFDDRHLRQVVRRAERQIDFQRRADPGTRTTPAFIEPYPKPRLWYDGTYHQDPGERAELMERLVQPARAAGMLSAGYLEVSAVGQASMSPERLWYYPCTQAQYSVTVRSPDGSGSGWAGMDHNDWAKIDAAKLSAIALEKCLRSRNPVRLEPGRYTTILEPQAVGNLVTILFNPGALDREGNEQGDPPILKTDPRYKKDPHGVFNDAPGYSKLGEQVIDPRLTVRTDCTDPDLGFVPFTFGGWGVYHPVTWIENGVLKELAYTRDYAVRKLGRNTGGIYQFGLLGAYGAFRMSSMGETASVEEMIAATKRGLLVTRFDLLQCVDPPSLLMTGYTRDGLWLIENGKISKAVKNFRFTESPMFALNNVEQIGTPQRIFFPGCPMVVPALKVRDFSFTAMSDAV